ncbi:protein kinase [Spirillospora sp. NPDC047279]|uniref:protein kinase domain-containing protein n=1 Tax=Spirillospora sp. NPDC047279 TaxID=3155478 RepID=UPI0034024785
MRVLGGRYELVELLGHGAMGTVHKARDRDLRRMVAVKLMRTELVDSPKVRARFRREAHAAAALTHPHIAVVHDLGEDDSADSVVPYLVLELIAGQTLAELIGERGAMPPDEAGEIILSVLDALDHSHRHRVVHRDLKPSNIMIDRSGMRPRVKVLDFGIAKVLSESITKLTRSGQVIGTLRYMPPEQAAGGQVDERSDLYALGCVLYELLTGQPPFTGTTKGELLHQHAQIQPRPPSGLTSGLPDGWDRLTLRALAKDPADRFGSAAEMHAQVQALVEPSPPAQPPPLSSPAPVPPPTGQDEELPDQPAGPERPRRSERPRAPRTEHRRVTRQREVARRADKAQVTGTARLICIWLVIVALAPVIGVIASGAKPIQFWPGPFRLGWLALIIPQLVVVAWIWQSAPAHRRPQRRVSVYLLAAAALATPVAMVFGASPRNVLVVVVLHIGGIAVWVRSSLWYFTLTLKYKFRQRFTAVAVLVALLAGVTAAAFQFIPAHDAASKPVKPLGLRDPSGKIRVSVPDGWLQDPKSTWRPSENGIPDDRATSRALLRAGVDPTRLKDVEHAKPGLFIGLTNSVKVPPAWLGDHSRKDNGRCTKGRPRTRTHRTFTATITPWTKCQRGSPVIIEIGLVHSTRRYAAWIRIKQPSTSDLTDQILDTVEVSPP